MAGSKSGGVVVGLLFGLVVGVLVFVGRSALRDDEAIVVRADGPPGSASFRLYFERGGAVVSPWHDVALRPAGADPSVVHMVVEIPRGATDKLQMSKDAAGNPIAPDFDQAGAPRQLPRPSPWNYGMVPQTWSDPSRRFAPPPGRDDPALKCPGDGDPIDVVEIGSRAFASGALVPVRVLGALALIDQGELDWKLLVVAVDDGDAVSLQSAHDLLDQRPDTVDRVRDWFRSYKLASGGHENRYAFAGALQPVDLALRVVHDAHLDWQQSIWNVER